MTKLYEAIAGIQNTHQDKSIVALVDHDRSFDPESAKASGVDLDTLLVSQPNDYDEAGKISEMLIKSEAVDVLIATFPHKKIIEQDG